MHRRVELRRGGVLEARAFEDCGRARRIGEGEGAGRQRIRRRLLGQERARRGEGFEGPEIFRHRAPAHEGEASAGLQRLAHIRESRNGIGEEHHAEARGDGVELRREGMDRGVGVHELRRQTLRHGTVPGGGKHGLGDVGAHDAAVRADRPGIFQRRPARAAADVEDVLARPGADEGQQRRADRRHGAVHDILRLRPALAGGAVPIFDLVGVGGRDVAHSGLPYSAARCSSMPA